jgi:ABC-type multidrug transport system fused ATPase/permease subunit
MKNIFKALKYYPNYRKTLPLALLVAILYSAIVTAIPLAIQGVIDRLFSAVASGQEFTVVLVPFGIWIGLRLFLSIIDWLQEAVADNLFNKGVIDYRYALVRKFQDLSLSYIEKRRVGQLASEINQSPYRLADWCVQAVQTYSVTILSALFALVVLAWKFPLIALIVLVLAGVYSSYVFRTMRLNRKYWKKHRKLANEYSGIQVENISFVSHIRALGANKQRDKLYKSTLNKHSKSMQKMFRMQHRRNFVAAILDLLLYAVPLSIFAVRAFNGQQSPTDIYVLSVYLGSISSASSRLSRMWSNTLEVNDLVGETLELLENTDTVTDPEDPKKLTSIKNISFNDTSFTYEGAKNEAVRGVSLSIEEGQTIALVGRSGSGKSTMVKLLLRFYDATAGSVEINGGDIKEYLQNDVRQKFGVVMQDVALFNDTIANNISIANPKASRADITKAAKLAHAHEFILGLPDGYDTLVGERGVKLSGGEKQRVSIARAVLRSPEVVLLDEATSALDSESEKFVQKGLKKLLEGRTAIIIAHRLSTITHADKIVVMDKGKIVETGTYEELKNSKGIFSDLLAHQQL